MSDKEAVYYDFDDFRLDLLKQKLLKNGQPVLLTHKAFQTLLILVQNFGQVTEKQTIYDYIWADSFVEEANLSQYIYVLRKTLGQNPNGGAYIETVSKQGYIFNADVKKSYVIESPVLIGNADTLAVTDSQNKTHTTDPQLHITQDKDEQLQEKSESPEPKANGSDNAKSKRIDNFSPKKLWSAQLILPVILAVAFISGLIFFLELRKPKEVALPGNKSIAVLPFKPIDNQSRELRLGLGMADAVITRLSKLQQMPVRPTSTVFTYTDESSPNAVDTGRKLGVDTILEGTIQRDGDLIRVSVQLINVADGKSLWAENFDEKYTHIFAVQDSISTKVAQSLSVTLNKQQRQLLTQSITTNPEASEAYQLGVYFWNTRTKENLEKAIGYFNRAIELDPNFAHAYATLADSYNMMGYYKFADPQEMLKKSQAAAEKALILDNTVPEAHIAIAFVQGENGNSEAARSSLERAIQLSPYNSTARVRYSWVLLRSEKINEAVREMRLAQEYDPLSPVSTGALCNMLVFQEDYPEAVQICRKAVDIAPDAADNRLVYANALFFNGNPEEAIRQAKIEMEQGRKKYSALGNIGYYYAKLGRRDETLAILAQLKPEAEKNPVLYNDLFLINYTLGRKDESYESFKKAYEKRILSNLMFKYDPVYKEIRSDPKFMALLKS